MSGYEPSKADWKRFCEMLPKWQEKYLARLCDEYAAILTGQDRGSRAYWDVAKRFREDKKHSGVLAEMKRSEMLWIISDLLRDKAITPDDLVDFSIELQDRITLLMGDAPY